MASAGLTPGPRAVHACVVAAAAAGDADGALDAMRRAHAAGLRPLPESYVALIHAFAGVGDAAAARAVLASMARAVPDARQGWLALCASLFRAGLGHDAEAALLRGRRADGWQPDADVFLEWMVWLCSTQGARGAKLAQFILSKDMRSAGVEPDIRHANTLLAADAFMLSPNVGEQTLLAISDGAFGPLCRPTADSHAIVMEAHLEVIESAARRAAPRLAGPDKEARMRLLANQNSGNNGHGSAAGNNGNGNSGNGNNNDIDPVAAVFASDPANYSQRGLDEGSDGVGAGHEALDEALGEMLKAGILPNRRVHAAMTRAKLVGGARSSVILSFFRMMVKLAKPGGGKRTDLLPDETMGALVAMLSEEGRPWDLLEVVSAAADDGRQLPAEAFGPRGLDAERLALAEEAFAAAEAAAAEGGASDDDEIEEEEEYFERGVESFFGDDDDENEERKERQRQRQEKQEWQKQKQMQQQRRRPSLSASSFLSPIADWIPKKLAAATSARVPGPGLVGLGAKKEEEDEDEGWELFAADGDNASSSSSPSASASFSSSSTSSSPSPDGVLIETLVDAQGRPQRRVTLSAGNAGSSVGAGGGGESSRHWVNSDGAVVVSALSPVYSSPEGDEEDDDDEHKNVGPGVAGAMVPISKATRDQLVAELAARGLPFAGMRRGEQYEAVKAARASDRTRTGGASDLDAVVAKRERAALALAAREAAKVAAAADEAASKAQADIEWTMTEYQDCEIVARYKYMAPPPGAEGAGDPDFHKIVRLPGSGIKDRADEEEETYEALLARVEASLAHIPVINTIHDGFKDDAFLEMTSKEVQEQAISRLLSGEPDEDDSLDLLDGYAYGGLARDRRNRVFPPHWPEGTRASALALSLLEAAERCGAGPTAADLAALAAAAAAAEEGPDKEQLALAVARRLGDGSELRDALSAPLVEAVGADLRRATRGGGGGDSLSSSSSSSARAVVEAALSAAGIGSHHAPAAGALSSAASAVDADEVVEAAGGDDDEDAEARAREEAEAEAVAAAVARAAAERAASPTPRIEGEVVRSPSAAAAAAAAAAANAAGRKAPSASSSLSSEDEEEEEEQEEEEDEDDEDEDDENEIPAAVKLVDDDDDEGGLEAGREEEGEGGTFAEDE